ncbi:response regulator transcription factor [Extibacter muris]|uniref:response regulator transcription factor n=1 Tax=Extibacter muris TaxID=1796622 RepID=UPI001D09325E|nr:response regulator transcription factor [Extibacter muris]MCB6203447.1 response regulator transcription factor [Extibacter muris]MCQ4665023.1 response regulator transcription factor [Extibacter muris]MCQ4694388.1 response regulator transcription factor [Extibacter muris]
MAEILIVEDDKSINELIQRTLRMMGHTGLPAYTGREALRAVDEKRPALMLLDLSLPDMDGFEVMEKAGDIPVICVTARDEIPDRVKGLMAGAEDYIVKPFALDELSARVQVVLRREHKEQTLYKLGSTEVDICRASVRRDGEPVELTHREYALLKVLLENCNIALSRSRILDLAWGMDYYGDDRTVDVHIRRLRQKLGLEDQIKTVFKYGYRLEI